MVTIEDGEVHLRTPSDEEVRNLTKAAIAKAKHNYNLRSSKRDGDQGEPGSMFIKEISQKKMASSNAMPQDGQTKNDQSKDVAKSVDNNTIGALQGTATVKKASQPKVEKAKINTELISSPPFDMTQALTQMKVTVPLVE